MRPIASLTASLIAASLCLVLAPRPAAAASFDGRWIADIPPQGRCNYTGLLTVLVAGDAVSGEVRSPDGAHSFTGTLDADGKGNVSIDHHFSGTIAFRGDRFESTWANNGCERHAAGDRAPDMQAQAALAQERKQRQAAYAEELRRAKAGEPVDYARMRADFVYAKDAQFYDGKAHSLLVQADAAVKGKDCAQAMPVLDQVLQLEFTNDSAHALLAECLRQTGEADKARVEDGIAKGLTHSLMDGWGGPHGLSQTLTAAAGSTEESAYVISTAYEEQQVLANRHIQVKTRQIEIRGSNGRYYDLVHGVSIDSGGGVIDAKGHDIYFDITAFPTMNASRRAAAQVLQAQLQ
jgi:hypothetical protein